MPPPGFAILLARGTGFVRASLRACRPPWFVVTDARCPCRTVILGTRDRCASAEVLAACGKLGMSTRLSPARLQLLGPVLLHGPQALLRLCDYLAARDRGWPCLIVGDPDLVHFHCMGGGLIGRRCCCTACLGRSCPRFT